MHTTRRQALKQCLIITIGAAMIPSCMQDKAKPAIVLKNLKFNSDDEKLFTAVCDTIIPATDTPGAEDTETDLFVLRMVDDVFPAEDQQQFVKGMKAFDKLAKAKLDKSFADAGVVERETLLTDLMNKDNKDGSEDIAWFLNTTKRLTIQGYSTGKYFLTQVKVYKLLPGKFSGCMPIVAAVS